jgi:hypothetical protein
LMPGWSAIQSASSAEAPMGDGKLTKRLVAYTT